MTKYDTGESFSKRIKLTANNETEELERPDLSEERFCEVPKDSYDTPHITSEDEQEEQDDQFEYSTESNPYSLIQTMFVNPQLRDKKGIVKELTIEKNVAFLNDLIAEELDIDELRPEDEEEVKEEEENAPSEDSDETSADDIRDLQPFICFEAMLPKTTKDGKAQYSYVEKKIIVKQQVLGNEVASELTAEELLKYVKKEILENDAVAEEVTAEELLKQVEETPKEEQDQTEACSQLEAMAAPPMYLKQEILENAGNYSHNAG